MKELEPGHYYTVEEYDDAQFSSYPIIFMKRIGEKFPGNQIPPHPGTNCQEIIRVLIARCKYLNNQSPCDETQAIIFCFRQALIQFENRAMRVKGLDINSVSWPYEIENLIPCKICGHIYPHICNPEKQP